MKVFQVFTIVFLVLMLLTGCSNQLTTQTEQQQSLALLPTEVNKATIIDKNSGTKTGIDASDGFYYSFWQGVPGLGEESYTGNASLTINTGTAGNYSTSWSNVVNFTAGKGWSTGKSDRVITYSGSFNGGSNGYLALYGWAKTSIAAPADYSVVEYYVIENYGNWTPPGSGTTTEPIVSKGSFTSDGSTYNMYMGTRIDRAWIVNNGTGDFNQYFSVRTSKRSSGTITFANHVAAWANQGLNLGALDYYQILETEGYHSSGSSNITVSEGTSTKTWQTLGTRPNQTVTSLTFNGNDLYIGGNFTTVGGISANRIAKYSNNTWSALGSGTNSPVEKIVFSGNSMYVGGQFSQAGSISNTNRIAKYSNGTWSALGSGMNGSVYDMAFGSNTLYAGGYFTTAGGTAVNHIAKWNGSAWSALGTFGAGLSSHSVNAMACDTSGNLYVGWSYSSGGASVNVFKVSKWNGSAWSDLGTFNSRVDALACSGSTLYAGGWFITVGNTAANRIAKWNGSSWSALGSGTNDNVWALACDTSGNLYAGGIFTTAGGITVNRIAKWNGSAWSAIGSGLDSYVRALAVDSSGNLYAGGDFFSHLLVYK